MADTSGQEKTEDPSAKRLDDARAEGNIPRSTEFSSAVMLFGGALILSALLPQLGAFVVETMGRGLYDAAAGHHAPQSLVARGSGLLWQLLLHLGTVLGALAVLAVVTGAAQSRGAFSAKPLAPKLNRLNPLQNAKRLIGMQGVAELVKSLVKLAIIGAVVYSAVDDVWRDMLTLAQRGPMGLILLLQEHALGLLLHAGMAYLALGAADYGFQWWRWRQGLMMTKQEVKEESKQSDGDPMIKARMRAAARALVRKRMLNEVPSADVVIVNPVHIAVAIKYDASVMPAPFVVAIGQRKVAERIKALAFESGVPVVENKPVARALLAAKVQPGTMIPVELYVAVAEVLAFVLRQRQRFGGRWAQHAIVDD
jgi:flagellar biosynthesis protein FlhB